MDRPHPDLSRSFTENGTEAADTEYKGEGVDTADIENNVCHQKANVAPSVAVLHVVRPATAHRFLINAILQSQQEQTEK
jgi:hypothetical protein